jgi:hypothetical protein
MNADSLFTVKPLLSVYVLDCKSSSPMSRGDNSVEYMYRFQDQTMGIKIKAIWM